MHRESKTCKTLQGSGADSAQLPRDLRVLKPPSSQIFEPDPSLAPSNSTAASYFTSCSPPPPPPWGDCKQARGITPPDASFLAERTTAVRQTVGSAGGRSGKQEETWRSTTQAAALQKLPLYTDDKRVSMHRADTRGTDTEASKACLLRFEDATVNRKVV